MDDEEIRLLLMEEDHESVGKALAVLLAEHRVRLRAMVRKKFSYFSESEVVDVLYETFRSLRAGLEAKTVDLNRPLAPLLYKVAYRRAQDLHRKRSAAKRNQIDYYADMAVILVEEGFIAEWNAMARSGSAAQILEEFTLLLPSLPRRQAAIAQAIADAFPSALSLEELCAEVEKLTGERISIPAAKSARDEVRKKMRARMYAKR